MLKMKKILVVFFSLFLFVGARAAQVANVEYVHNLISHVWGVDVPYNANLKSVKSVANMEYLLTAVDVANGLLNKGDKTDYRNSEYATRVAVDVDAVNDAVENLIKKPDGGTFYLYTTSDTSSFSMKISAAGSYMINWGDGTAVKFLEKTNTDLETISYNYATAGSYVISVSGRATAYNTDEKVPAISFEYNNNIAAVDGDFGMVFGTLENGAQPNFYAAFADCKNLKSISDTMFDGVYGQPIKNMFYATFDGCSGLEAIPENLFAGLSGTLTEGLFYMTFQDCTSLAGIPSNLFGEFYGALQRNVFVKMFSGCVNLGGWSAQIVGLSGGMQYLYMRWTGGTSATVNDMYKGCTGLQDYASIPTVWK